MARRQVKQERKNRVPLSALREMSQLCKKHWGDGSLRHLLLGAGNYRPTLVTEVEPRTTHRRLAQGWTTAEVHDFATDCAERRRLADLYDMVQAARFDNRRAARY